MLIHFSRQTYSNPSSTLVHQNPPLPLAPSTPFCMPSAAYPSSMFSPAGQSPMLNNGGVLDGSGTIDPATLNPTAFSSHLSTGSHIPPYSPPTSNTTEFDNDSKPGVSALANSSPRGVKRSRSPAEPYRDGAIAGDDLGTGTRITFFLPRYLSWGTGNKNNNTIFNELRDMSLCAVVIAAHENTHEDLKEEKQKLTFICPNRCSG